MPRVKAFLNALAIGILIFLLWDVLTNAWEPTDAALGSHHYATAVTYGGVMLVLRRRRADRPGLLRPVDEAPGGAACGRRGRARRRHSRR